MTPATAATAPAANGRPPVPFAFLGKIPEDGQTVVLLHYAGRVLKIRGPGPITDDYEVDALLENLVVLRHVPLGTQQVIELTARNISTTSDEAPQD